MNFDEAVQRRRRRHRRRRRQAERRDPGGDQGPADPRRLVQGRLHPQGRHHLDRGGRPARRSRTGKLIFHRNWGYVQPRRQERRHSKVEGKFDAAPLPGITGPGVSSLGGHNYAIAKNAENKGTALDFLKFMSSAGGAEGQALKRPRRSGDWRRSTRIRTSLKKFPFYPILLKSIEGAKPRPKAVEYGDVTLAIQDAAYGALQGQTAPDAALQSLQTKLQTLIK